jgi:hypothetical protein
MEDGFRPEPVCRGERKRSVEPRRILLAAVAPVNKTHRLGLPNERRVDHHDQSSPVIDRVIMENVGGDAPFGGDFGAALDPDEDFFPDRQTDRLDQCSTYAMPRCFGDRPSVPNGRRLPVLEADVAKRRLTGRCRRIKAICHVFCIRKSHASLPLPLSLVVVRTERS